jgi:hypothetical protein
MPWLGVNERNLPRFMKGEKIEVSKVELYEVGILSSTQFLFVQTLCFTFFSVFDVCFYFYFLRCEKFKMSYIHPLLDLIIYVASSSSSFFGFFFFFLRKLKKTSLNSHSFRHYPPKFKNSQFKVSNFQLPNSVRIAASPLRKG